MSASLRSLLAAIALLPILVYNVLAQHEALLGGQISVHASLSVSQQANANDEASTQSRQLQYASFLLLCYLYQERCSLLEVAGGCHDEHCPFRFQKPRPVSLDM